MYVYIYNAMSGEIAHFKLPDEDSLEIQTREF